MNITKILLSALILAVVYVYLHTTYPAFNSGDSPETAAAIHTLGIGHPPSYPLHTMAGKIVSLVPYGSPAFRANLFSILLSAAALLAAFIFMNMFMSHVFGRKTVVPGFAAVVLLAGSYIFWNQAIESKGGIYILNLLLMILVFTASLKFYETGRYKYALLIAYLSGLSMANHWPSAVMLAPAAAYIFLSRAAVFNVRRVVVAAVFFAAGMSAYLYLPVRGACDGVFVLMENPSSLSGFLWTVLRLGYENSVAAQGGGYAGYQAVYFVRLLGENYSVCWPFAVFGIYAVWKKKKESALLPLAVFILISAAVVLLNKTPKEQLRIMGNFLMPAQFVVMMFITAGMYRIYEIIKSSRLKKVYAAAAALLAVFAGFAAHFSVNNGSRNFLAYDFGANILSGLKTGDSYFYNGDFFGMPLVYYDVIEGETKGINYQSLHSLGFSWGKNLYYKRYGVRLSEGAPAEINIGHALGGAALHGRVFINGYPGNMDAAVAGMKQRVSGIPVFLSADGEIRSYRIFDMYSYRGIRGAQGSLDRQLASLYSTRLIQRAGESLQAIDYAEAVLLYRRALGLYTYTNEWRAWYNLSVAYRFLGDSANELLGLKKAIQMNQSFYRAYEEAAALYIKEGKYSEAAGMLKKAVEAGAPDRGRIEQNIQMINRMTGH